MAIYFNFFYLKINKNHDYIPEPCPWFFENHNYEFLKANHNCWPYPVRQGYCVISSFKGFCPLSTRWDYSSQFGCKKIHIHFLTFCFFYHLLKCAPTQLTLLPIYNHKIKYENNFSKNDCGTHHTQKLM
jgi:hypothetical protein